jgi:hypothetical protein
MNIDRKAAGFLAKEFLYEFLKELSSPASFDFGRDFG